MIAWQPRHNRLSRLLEVAAVGLRMGAPAGSYLTWRRLFKAGFTLLTPARDVALAALARAAVARGVPGAIVDCGVWRGGSTAILSKYAPRRPV